MSKVIIHVDLNAFFAACEILENPSLKGKPIAIGGKSSKSVISTASYEARKYGVHSAMPSFMAKKLCPDLIIIEPHFDLYQRKSTEFFNILKTYSPIMEIASIDECYMDITSIILKQKDPLSFIKSIQDDVLKRTGLGCSIGVAPNKFLAKMASDYKKPLGLTLIRKKDVKEMLWPLDINQMYGIGQKSSEKLKKIGINTIGDLATFEDIDTLRSILGKAYYSLKENANGNGDDYVNYLEMESKSIGNSITLKENSNNFDYLSNVILDLSKHISTKLKEENLIGKTVELKLKDANFKSITRSTTLTKYIQDSESIAQEAIAILEENYDPNIYIRLVGVTLKNLTTAKPLIKQLNLFEMEPSLDNKIDNIIDKINKDLGYEALTKASKIRKKEK